MSSDYQSRKLDKFVVRFPDGMREKLGEAARSNKRTMNAEIVHRLEDSFSQASDALDGDTVTPDMAKMIAELHKKLVIGVAPSEINPATTGVTPKLKKAGMTFMHAILADSKKPK